MLHPIFEEASNIVREEFPNTKQVVFARVDCDQHCEYIFNFLFFFAFFKKMTKVQKIQMKNNEKSPSKDTKTII